jgi:hypothetical protein
VPDGGNLEIHLGRQLGVDPASVEADVQQRLRNIPK